MVGWLHLNVTHRKELESKLLESKMQFRNFVENLSDWIWETDVKGHYIYTSLYMKIFYWL